MEAEEACFGVEAVERERRGGKLQGWRLHGCCEASGREGGQVETAAQILNGQTGKCHFHGIGRGAAQIEEGWGAGLAGLDDRGAGQVAQVAEERSTGEQIVGEDERGGRGELRDGGRLQGVGRGVLRGDAHGVERDVAGEEVCAAGVEGVADQGGVYGCNGGR